jgi:DNA (cytosine-5)-methyltransferase 1
MADRLNVIDLFAGVGGLSLGAARAGFRVAAAVELDRHALQAHHVNFPKVKHLGVSVADFSGEDLLRQAGLKKGSLGGLIGGPPCQGFSSMGHGKVLDPRNDLIRQFCRLVAETNPAFYLFENVPGVLRLRYQETLREALSLIPAHFVRLDPFKINAKDCGAPTDRTRVIFVGFDPSRIASVAMDDFRPKNQVSVRVGEALVGLPPIRANWSTREESLRPVRSLPGGEFGKRVSGCIPSGLGDKASIKLWKEDGVVSGCSGTIHTEESIRRFSQVAEGATDPVSRFPRLDRQGYCPTLRAGTGPDMGSYQSARPIHPTSHRVITPREGARLQGFPDWFQFDQTKWHSFRQIGNSVSPMVSEHLLGVLHGALSG